VALLSVLVNSPYRGALLLKVFSSSGNHHQGLVITIQNVQFLNWNWYVFQLCDYIAR